MSEFTNLQVIAERLHMTVARIWKLSLRGKYPEVLHPARGVYLVKQADHDHWEANRWSSARRQVQTAGVSMLRGEIIPRKRA